MPKRLAKSRERRKKPPQNAKGVKWTGAATATKESPPPPPHFFFVGTSQSFRLIAKVDPFSFVVSFVFALKGCRPKGTKGTTPAVLLRVQTPPPTSRILRRGFQTTMSGATEESVVPAALWSRVDAAKGTNDDGRCSFLVMMMMMMGSTSSPPANRDGGMPLLFLSVSLSLFLSLVESENERTKRRQKPSSLAHSCAVFIVVVVALIDGVLFTSSPLFLLLLETQNQHRTDLRHVSEMFHADTDPRKCSSGQARTGTIAGNLWCWNA